MKKYNPNIHHRRSIRLKNYDYSQEGFYFITICTENRINLFGTINNDEMELNDAGKMVENEWIALQERFPQIEQHEYIVMPNHFHGILEIKSLEQNAENKISEENDTKNKTLETQKLGDFIGAFKSITTLKYIQGVKANQKDFLPFEKRIWQRNYYENIIRNEKTFYTIANYINENPKKWQEDKFHNNS
jgi:putative transposase